MFFILDTADRLGFLQTFLQLEPKSPQGIKIKKNIQPCLPGDEQAYDLLVVRLRYWKEIVENTDFFQEIVPLLAELKNIDGILERLANQISLDEGEFFSIKANLLTTRKIVRELNQIKLFMTSNRAAYIDRDSTSPSSLYQKDPAFKLDPLDRLWDLLNPGGIESDRFFLRNEYDRELTIIRDEIDLLQEKIRVLKKSTLADLEERLGRFIPLSGEIMVDKCNEELFHYIKEREDMRLRRETFSSYIFDITYNQEIQLLENKLKQLEFKEEEIKNRVLIELSRQTEKFSDILIENQQSLGELDWMLAKVEHACKFQCQPALRVDTNLIQIKGGRHLLVEAEVEERGSVYTPIDVELNQGVTVITGSNMGGKTLTLRMIGLLVAMAQHGLCVPAAEMKFNLRSFIYFSVDDDQTSGDLSSFGQEIVGLKEALIYKDEMGLLLIDELGRGTNPEEGGALGIAIIKHLQNCPTISVLTTHFTALTLVKGIKHLQVIGLNQEKYDLLQRKLHLDKEEVSLKIINHLMDYRLIDVGQKENTTQDALKVAALLGLNEEIIKDAVKELGRND